MSRMFKKKKTISVHTKNLLLCGVLLCVCVMTLDWAYTGFKRHARADDMHLKVQGELLRTQERLEDLDSQNQLLELGTGQEDVLLERFALKKPGERVLILVEDKRVEDILPEEDSRGWWEKFIGWFD